MLAPPVKPQYRCSCAVRSSCRNRAVHNSISAKTRRTSQPIRTPLSTIAGVHEIGSTPVLVNRPHAGSEGFVAALSCRTLSLTPRIEPARGDTEHSGHRGDAQLGLMRSHEPVDLPGPTSRANQAVAFASIARSSRTRRFSRRSRRISSRSALLSPSPRRPSSRSACATQLRIAWAVGSNSRASSSAVRPVRAKATRRPSGAGRLAGTAVSISAWWIPPPQRVRGSRNRVNSSLAPGRQSRPRTLDPFGPVRLRVRDVRPRRRLS